MSDLTDIKMVVNEYLLLSVKKPLTILIISNIIILIIIGLLVAKEIKGSVKNEKKN